jgi:hypothetical protein
MCIKETTESITLLPLCASALEFHYALCMNSLLSLFKGADLARFALARALGVYER